MTGDGLLNSILKERFDNKWDDPSQFWFSGLVEGLIYRGEERHLAVNFFPLLSPPSRPLSESKQLSPTISPSDQKFNIRVWNMMHAGLVHQSGIALHRHKQVLFPKVKFNLEAPYKEDFIKFKELEFYHVIKKLLHTRELGDNIQLVKYNNIKSTDGATYDHVVIPCAEIARFYFFNSSNIIEPLLKPGALNKSNNQLFVAERSGIKYDQNNQPFHVIILEKSMTRTDAAVIARIAFSEVAQSAAAILNASCLEKINYRSFIKCPFPFSEPTTLHATCLSLNQNGKRILLVMELLTCTAPFPFEFLAVGQDIEGESKKGMKNSKSSNSGSKDQKKKKPVVDITTPPTASDDDDAGGAFDLEDLTVFSFKERFKALDTKKILKLKQDALVKNNPNGKVFRVIKTISTNSKKDGGPGGARISSKNKEGKKPSIKKFTPDETKKQDQVLKVDRFKMMYAIKKHFEKSDYNVSFHKWIKVNDDSDFTYFYEQDMNTESRWPFLDFTEGILRRGLCLCISDSNNNTFYLLDVEVANDESSLKLFALNDLDEMEAADSEEVLTCLLDNGGKLSRLESGANVSLLPGQFFTRRFYHNIKWSAEKYAEVSMESLMR